jgi:prepilin-type N-terminal cleavage/methylation domain-containing protein
MNKKNSPLYRHRGFTLIELLTVIAIIGILAGIIFPATGAVRRSANNTKSRTQFTNWAAAIETFRSEYRYYPTFGAGDGVISLGTPANRNNFIETLSGRTLAGARPGAGSVAGQQNRRFIGFYSFGDGEFAVDGSGNRTDNLADAFGNIDIVVAVDHNLNGRTLVGQSTPSVTSADTGNSLPVASLIPSGGVRAGVSIYSAGSGRAARDIVRTWGN